jgi:hypothetical protein
MPNLCLLMSVPKTAVNYPASLNVHAPTTSIEVRRWLELWQRRVRSELCAAVALMKIETDRHTDSGKLAPAIPELASIYGAGMISMSWYPGRTSL